jgi:hypothetical protein
VKRQTNSKSILLKKYGETTDQSASACPILAEEQYRVIEKDGRDLKPL